MGGGYAVDHAQMAATVVAKRLSGILRSRISRAGPARLTGRPSQGRIAIHWPRKDKLGLLPAAKPLLQLRCPTSLVTFFKESNASAASDTFHLHKNDNYNQNYNSMKIYSTKILQSRCSFRMTMLREAKRLPYGLDISTKQDIVIPKRSEGSLQQ